MNISAIIDAQDLCVRHPSSPVSTPDALSEITLRINVGEQVALIGPSGAGKTTLLRTLAMAQQPSTGELHILDQLPWKLSTADRHNLRKQLFYCPQSPPLPPRQRVVTAVLAGQLPQWSLWQSLKSLMYPQHAQLAYDALVPVQLQDKIFNRVDRLSGGERQRVSLARMMATQKKLWLVDEPLSALDPRLAVQTLQVVQDAAVRQGTALVCSLHQVELAHAKFSRLIGLRQGKIIFDLPAAQVTSAMLSALYDASEHASTVMDAQPQMQLHIARTGCG